MHLSLQVQYAICAVFDLAYNGHGAPVQVRVVGERQAVPARYLEQIFQRLRRARLVTSKRGPRGGYTLAREPAEITLGDVVEAVEGSFRDSFGRDPPARGRATDYRPSFVWQELGEQVRRVLTEMSIESLCREASQASVRRAPPQADMYFI